MKTRFLSSLSIPLLVLALFAGACPEEVPTPVPTPGGAGGGGGGGGAPTPPAPPVVEVASFVMGNKASVEAALLSRVDGLAEFTAVAAKAKDAEKVRFAALKDASLAIAKMTRPQANAHGTLKNVRVCEKILAGELAILFQEFQDKMPKKATAPVTNGSSVSGLETFLQYVEDNWEMLTKPTPGHPEHMTLKRFEDAFGKLVQHAGSQGIDVKEQVDQVNAAVTPFAGVKSKDDLKEYLQGIGNFQDKGFDLVRDASAVIEVFGIGLVSIKHDADVSKIEPADVQGISPQKGEKTAYLIVKLLDDSPGSAFEMVRFAFPANVNTPPIDIFEMNGIDTYPEPVSKLLKAVAAMVQ